MNVNVAVLTTAGPPRREGLNAQSSDRTRSLLTKNDEEMGLPIVIKSKNDSSSTTTKLVAASQKTRTHKGEEKDNKVAATSKLVSKRPDSPIPRSLTMVGKRRENYSKLVVVRGKNDLDDARIEITNEYASPTSCVIKDDMSMDLPILGNVGSYRQRHSIGAFPVMVGAMAVVVETNNGLPRPRRSFHRRSSNMDFAPVLPELESSLVEYAQNELNL